MSVGPIGPSVPQVFRSRFLDEPEFRILGSRVSHRVTVSRCFPGSLRNQAFGAAYIASYVDDRGEQLTEAKTT